MHRQCRSILQENVHESRLFCDSSIVVPWLRTTPPDKYLYGASAVKLLAMLLTPHKEELCPPER
jgi:hypothetical protein